MAQPADTASDSVRAISRRTGGSHMVVDVPTEGEMSARGDARRGSRGPIAGEGGALAQHAGWTAIEARAARYGEQDDPPHAGRRGALRGVWRAGSRGTVPVGDHAAGTTPTVEPPVALIIPRTASQLPAVSLTLVVAGPLAGDDRRLGSRIGLGAIALEVVAADAQRAHIVSAELVDGSTVLASGAAGGAGGVGLRVTLTREQACDALFCFAGWPSRLVVRAVVVLAGDGAHDEALASIEHRLDQVIAASLTEQESDDAITVYAVVPGPPGLPADVVSVPGGRAVRARTGEVTIAARHHLVPAAA
ncbi:MAG: hypothetical protein ACKVUT_18240 [Gaiella sp.]